MQSTLSVFPGTRRVLDSTKLPFVIYTTPIPDDLPALQSGAIDIPRCPNPACTAFFSGLCHYGPRSWTCSVCGCQCSSPPPLSVASLANYQIVDSSVAFPLTHVVVIGCEDVAPARAIMQCLPPDAPVQIFVMNSAETARKLVTVAGSLSQLRRLPIPHLHIAHLLVPPIRHRFVRYPLAPPLPRPLVGHPAVPPIPLTRIVRDVQNMHK
jgi:hypothetical protein